MNNVMTRRDFLKKSVLVSAAFCLFGRSSLVRADASVIDNLGGSNGIFTGDSPPSTNSSYLYWLDTSGGQNILKFRPARNVSAWKPVSSVWS